MNRYLAREPYAVAVVEAWRWHRGTQRPAKRYVPESNEPSTTPEWRTVISRSQSDAVVRMCRSIASDDDFEDLAQETLLALDAICTNVQDMMRYARGIAQRKQAQGLRGRYVGRAASIKRYVPLDELRETVSDHFTDNYVFNRELVPSSPQTAEIAALLRDGKTIRQIGKHLGIDSESVRKRVMRDRKSGLVSRLQASAAHVTVMLTHPQKAMLEAA